MTAEMRGKSGAQKGETKKHQAGEKGHKMDKTEKMEKMDRRGKNADSGRGMH